MLNASSLRLSLANSTAEQLKAIVSFIDQLIAGQYRSKELLHVRDHLTSPEAQAMTAEMIARVVWGPLQAALPPYLCFESLDDEDTAITVQPDLDVILDEAKPSLGTVVFVNEGEAWPDERKLASKVRFATREWWDSGTVELFDCATRRVVWTYTFASEAIEAI